MPPPTSSTEVFTHDVFLSHSSKDKAVVRPLAERLRKDGLRVWIDEWEIPVAAGRQSAAFSPEGQEPEDGGARPRRRYAEKIEHGLGRSRPTFQPSAFSLQPFPDAPIKGSLAQFLYINWLPTSGELEGAWKVCSARSSRRESQTKRLENPKENRQKPLRKGSAAATQSYASTTSKSETNAEKAEMKILDPCHYV